MTERLKIQLSGANPIFKLSKPGVDVNTATYDQMLFDISQGVYSGVFMSGRVPISSFSDSTAPNYYGWSTSKRYEIPFGKTFTAIPKVGLSFNDAQLGAGWYSPQYAPGAASIGGVQTMQGSGCAVGTGCEVYNDKLVLLATRVYFSGTQWPFPDYFWYIVYHG